MIRILQQDNRFIKIVFAIIIGFAVVTMVITLVPGIFDNANGANGSVNYATVRSPGFLGKFGPDNQSVTQMEVAREAQQQLQQSGYPASPMILQYLEGRVAPELVQKAMLKIEADKLGLQVGDEDLRQTLHTGQLGQILFPNGQYIGDDAYMNFVQNQVQMTRGDFEDMIKKSMEISRLYAFITAGVTVPDNAVRDSFRVSGTKVKFDYAVLSSDDIRKNVNPTDADLEAFFHQNAPRYATAVPESRKIQYVAFGADETPGGRPQVSDADLQAYYNAHLATYQVKDQVKARHILIAVKDGADAATDAAAKAKAEDILKQLHAGGNFAELASKNSDDPGSKATGGDLPFMSPGQTVPEFNKALFSMRPGQTSDLVKTKFGYHIIQVQEKQTAHTKPLAEVKSEILPVLEQQKLGASETAYAKTLADEAKKNGLDKTAVAHNLHVNTTDYIARDGIVAGVSDSAALLTQAFAAARGAAPASVSTGDGYAVFQVADIKAPHAPEFDAFKTHILEDYRTEKVPQLLTARLNKLDARARELNDLHKAAAEMNIPVKSSDLVGKEAQVPDLGAMAGPGSVAFSLAKGAISNPINTGNSGIVLSVLDKQEPGPEEVAKNFNKTREQMLSLQKEEVFRLYIGTLSQKYEKAGAIRYSAPQKGASPLG